MAPVHVHLYELYKSVLEESLNQSKCKLDDDVIEQIGRDILDLVQQAGAPSGFKRIFFQNCNVTNTDLKELTFLSNLSK